MGVSMEMPPFTMTLFQSAYGQVVAWCEYSSSETDSRIADNSLQLAVISYTLNYTSHFGPSQRSKVVVMMAQCTAHAQLSHV